MKPLAWLIEEYDTTGKMLWYGIVMSEPTELSWYKDLKKNSIALKLHHLLQTLKAL